MKGVAGAPVSFGIFELATRGLWADPDAVLAVLREAGYDGVDLGPVGWLGRGRVLRERLDRHRLALAGGWVDLPFSDDGAFAAALPALTDALEIFAAGQDPDRPPLPTLADSGSPQRRAHPGAGERGRRGVGESVTPGGSDELDHAGWARLAANVAEAAAQVRAAGLEPTFHHHLGTYVETPDEVDQLLQRTDIGLTLDTGHLLLAGGDPVAALARWRGRVNHVHLKDARRAVLDQAVREGAGMREVWRRRVFVPLGAGDLDLAGFMESLLAAGFDGWLVVEQDVLPAGDCRRRGADPGARRRRGAADPGAPAQPAADQRANRATLRRWLP